MGWVWAISAKRPFLILFCELVPIAGGGFAAAGFLALIGLGLIAPPWIWVAAGLFMMSLTLSGILSFLRMRRGSDLKADKSDEFDDEDSEFLRRTSHPIYGEQARRDLLAGIAMWWVAVPALIFGVWAWSEPVLDWSNPLDWRQVLCIAAGVLLFAKLGSAHLLEPQKRTWLRAILAVAVVAVLVAGLWERHPYLLPGYPDAARVKVEQLFKSGDLKSYHYHTAALTKYAQELEGKGEIQKAGDLFNIASRVDVTDAGLQENFAKFLTRHAPAGEDAVFYQRAAEIRSGAALKASREPYAIDPHGPLPMLMPDSPLEHAVVLVADQDTSPELLDLVGHVLGDELKLPVYRYPLGVDFSKVAGRGRGEDGPQMRIDQAWAAVAAQIPISPLEPRQYLVITVRDLYADGVNYLYNSATIPGCGIASYQRLGKRYDPCNDRDLLEALCKQSLATVIKSLTLYPCPDLRDVTAYVDGPSQLGRKGRHALPATLSAYRYEAENWAAARRKAREMRGQ
ncbi:hypothetical protein [Haloferula sp. BvORR071]|uniref:hypothetical protein n=1 Tax=Haloferula sp. BvORR071 TaxID=1396141 RepID=UPI0005537B09|nr:hypothetical protein [Haloferula sp. BvORR071]